MADKQVSRRDLIKGASLSIAAFTAGGSISRAEAAENADPYRYCLNPATIMGYNLDIVKQIKLAGEVGYDAMEPWVRDISRYKEAGGLLSDLKKRFSDAGLTVESSIGFTSWIIDDDEKRKAGIEQMKRDMDLVAQVGGKRIAAPPVGATREGGLDLLAAARRYRTILDIGDKIGVVPQIEVWGFSKNLHRIGQSMFVVIESGHPKACLLPDFYHIYKGGSDFEGLRQLSKSAVQVFHMNDYPDIPRDKIGDKDRVFPGDGICPLPELIRMMADNGVYPVFSIEIFNKDYWSKFDAKTTASTGLQKMKAVTKKAMSL